jgi:molecular chaperone GrpE
MKNKEDKNINLEIEDALNAQCSSVAAEKDEDEPFSEACGGKGENEVCAEEIDCLKGIIEELSNEKEDALRKYMLLTADFDNFRRRARAEKEETVKCANSRLIGELLPIMDNFARAMAAADDSPFAEGINMIYRQMDEVLKQDGLEKIKTIGTEFDPRYHEALLSEYSGEEKKDTVLEEIQAGYLYKGRLLRPAKVKVGS